MTTDPKEAAQTLLQNSHFLELFQRTLTSSGGKDGGATLQEALRDMPAEGDPAREAWLRKLQETIHHEMLKEATTDLEQVHSDDKGQWMYVLPRPGFCIKCTTAGGGKVFINVSQHERIAEPMPLPSSSSKQSTAAAASGAAGSTRGKPAEDGDEDEIQFRIPLSCGQARPEKDKAGRSCKVYDVIVNPATVDRCGREPDFRRFVAALCMQWIRQKSEPTLNAEEFRNLNFRVKGTLEPQRIRLSHTAPPANAMNDEIKLPITQATPTAPSPAGGVATSGKLIEEIRPTEGSLTAPNGNKQSCAADAAHSTATATATSSSDALADTTETTTSAAATENTPRNTVSVVAEGSYDWSSHRQPTASPFFREAVPQSYAVVLHLPDVQTIREVDVRLSSRRLECYHVACDEDEKEEEAVEQSGGLCETPFVTVRFDYPVSDTVYDAKFVKKTALLRLRCRVQLPDETSEDRTRPDRDATEEEAEAARRAEAERQAAWQVTQERQARQAAEESAVQAERRRLVEGMAAVQSGEVPQELRDEFDAMPREQLPVLLQRLEGRVRRGDSVDRLLETLPEVALEGLCAYIREKLSLQPRVKHAVCGSASGTQDAMSTSSTLSLATQQKEHDTHTSKDKDVKMAPSAAKENTEQDVNQYNSMKKSERLFGVEFRNRYLFALDV